MTRKPACIPIGDHPGAQEPHKTLEDVSIPIRAVRTTSDQYVASLPNNVMYQMRNISSTEDGSNSMTDSDAVDPGKSILTFIISGSNVDVKDLTVIILSAIANNARLIRRGDQTTLTSFFMLCLAEPEVAGKMLYKDIPTVYRWDKKSKLWVQYKRYVPSLGRVVHVSPQDPELFYLRLLLCYRRRPTSFEDLRTIDNVMYPTFHEAAMAAGYLENDREWEECLLEASYERMPYQLRQLFGTILSTGIMGTRTSLVYSLPGSPLGLWERFKSDLSEDFQRGLRMDADDRKVEFKTLKSLDNILRINGKTLENYGLPVLEDYREEADANEQDTGGLTTAAMVTRLNPNQQDIFDQVISAVESPEVGQTLFFVGGPGGTGKSFLIEQLLAKVRLEGGVAIAVASSGIATLLTGGRTAHSMFRIPLKPNEHSTCGISKQTQKANLIRQARLIIWNEAPMMHRSCFEAVDRTFRDIMDNDREPFGGKAIAFSGDHRQILPVLKDATRAETLKACFKASPLWRHLKQVRLFENMGVRTAPDPDDAAELAEFSAFLLQIGEGRFQKCIDAAIMTGPRRAFAMTINKAQGQAIHHVSIYLESPAFAHGQLYVALSRVTSRKAIKIAIDPETVDEDGSVSHKISYTVKFLSDTAQYCCD
ncbi:LOW QUALITY PROTEIN: Helitron helicase [Phytophthora megakarya]|uniref:ATP-dependent DNA helicase n=1 Tax=Phytophthora megakarya TaxID=4795 RepID=A0A225W5Q3_9STRA|nr:LOW QUALITY PROTEIN: Helitron helicase [Phytophthora megakarya]